MYSLSSAPSLEQDQPVLEKSMTSTVNDISIPVQTEPAEGRMISFGESLFSGCLDDNAVASITEGGGVHEVSSRDNGNSVSTCMGVERNEHLPNEPLSSPNYLQTGIKFQRYPSRQTPTASSESRPGNSPRELLHHSSRTGRPVDQNKKYIEDKPADFPVDDSTFNTPPISEPAKSQTRKGQDTKGSKTSPPMGDGRSSPYGLTGPLTAPRFPHRRKRQRANYRKKRRALRKKAAKLRREKEAAEATGQTRVLAEETARNEIREEEERPKRGRRRIPMGELIQPLDAKWEKIVYDAMASPGMQEVLATTSNGCKLTRRDLGTLKVLKGRDPPCGWLNDEIISAYLQHVVDYGLRKSNHKVGETPKYHAFNPFFYTNLRKKGIQSVERWATRAKVGKENLLNVERLFIPVHFRLHWSLIVVSPISQTIEYFDSLGGPAHPYILNAAAWLRAELGNLFKEEEWTVPTGSLGAGPQQSNGSDCGVFICTNAKMVLLGLNPMEYAGSDCEIQRTRMVAELLNGGLKGDFEPTGIF